MKVLMMSMDGDGLGIAQKMVEDGDEVDFWIKNKQYEFAGLGIVNRVGNWRPSVRSADLVVFDMVGFGHLERQFQKRDAITFGLSKIADLMELDREKQAELFERFDVRTPQTMPFSSPSEALDVIEIWEEPGYVLKPSGNIETGKTIIARDRETFKWALEQYTGDQDLIVQRIVEGVEVSTEGWFDGGKWLPPYNHTFEEKRFLENNLGPHTGCMGNVVVTFNKPDRLVEETLFKIEPFLKSAKYKGPIDINAIVNKDGIHALEITARFGYDAIEALHSLMNEPISRVLMDIAVGSELGVLPVSSPSFSTAIRLSVAPYPHADPDKDERGFPINLINPDTNIYLTDVMKDGKVLRWAAGDGVVCKVTGTGSTLQGSIKSAYKRVGDVNFIDMQYRTDIGARVAGDMKELKKFGVL